jgi:tetratricopeptide (TPR) repeat protein
MSAVAKLKKKAAEFELKKQFDKALAVYVEILDGYGSSEEEVDVSLFNRVGDLYLKQGSVGDAVDYYEQAVDRYAEGGFHNNAIALCNKILRNSPGRASVYYTLGKISAQKGFKGDAKKNFLEYADRMQASGKIDEAFRALKEFADLCPDQDDIRLMLAEQLSKKGRGPEAIEQLQLLYVRYSHEGRITEARATVERMKTIDPTAEPRELGAAPRRSAADLIFLDLSDGAPPGRISHATRRVTLEIEAPTLEPVVTEGVTRVDDFERSGEDAESGSLLEGLETTSFPVILPEVTPVRGTPIQRATDGLPLLDIELPSGESNASIADAIPERNLEIVPTQFAGRRKSTVIAAQDTELLQAASEADPDDHAVRRRLAEAMLESGDREGGLRELETAMVGLERNEDLAAASELADEIVLLNPGSVRHHQKRVEYAFRTNERGRLIEAYLQLAAALFRAGQVEKARAIYQRVIDLAPEDRRAQAALEHFPEAEPGPEPVLPSQGARQTARMSRLSMAVPTLPITPAATPDDEYINLGDWLRDDEAPKDTRMVVDEEAPTGDEEADFQDMLKKFKHGILQNVEEEDHQSHYDLGVAYKEMGLLDEAISEFQKALRAPVNRVSTYEALGLCFIEKAQFSMAATILGRALHEPGISETQLIGVLYLLGRCAQERGQREAAIEYYQRVFVIDIQFQDVGERLATVEGGAS